MFNRAKELRASLVMMILALVFSAVLIYSDSSIRARSFKTSGFELNQGFIDPYALSKSELTKIAAEPSLGNGITLVRKVPVFQPVTVAHRGYDMIDLYRQTGQEKFLLEAERLLQLIIDHAVLDNQNREWIPYNFDFPLHQDKNNTIHATWHSAMAQGLVLSLSSRLYEETKDLKYLKESQKVFAALDQIFKVKDLKKDSQFVTFIDDKNYLWLEEYAGDVAPMKVINGHIFAIFGLADYWKVSASSEAADLIDGGATTIDHYFNSFRNPGGVAWYGLRVQNNPNALSKKYHRIVTDQLKVLASITNDPRFSKESKLLKSDFA